MARRHKNLKLSHCLEQAIDRFAPRIPHQPKAFTTGTPAFDAFPLAQWSRLVSRPYREKRDIVMGYGGPEGYFPLRKAIANQPRGNRGLECEPDTIFIVRGAPPQFNLLSSVLHHETRPAGTGG